MANYVYTKNLNSVVDCGHLSNLENGMIDQQKGTTYLMQAMYICNNGFTLFGTQSRICTANGSWTLTPPICQCTSSLNRTISSSVIVSSSISPLFLASIMMNIILVAYLLYLKKKLTAEHTKPVQK